MTARPFRPSPPTARIAAALRRAGHGLALLWLCLLLWLPPAATAATQTTETAQTATLQALRHQLDGVRNRLADDHDDAGLNDLRQQALQIHAQVREYAQSLSPGLPGLQNQLDELGDAPAGHAEIPEIAQQRSELAAAIAGLESQQRLANVLLLEAEQVLGDVSSQRRMLFQTQLWLRSPSILTGRFWTSLSSSQNPDTQRGTALRQELQAFALAVPAWLWLGLLAWSVAILLLHRRLRLRLRELATQIAPAGRLRRCLYAWSQTLLASFSPFLVFGGIYLALSWFDPLPEPLRAVLAGLIGVAAYCGYTAGLGSALLAASSPSWRLPPMQDRTALALKQLPALLALLLAGNWLAEELGRLGNVRLGLNILSNNLFSLAIIAALAISLYRITHFRRQQEDGSPAGTGTWVAVLLGKNCRLIEAGLWLALALALVTLLIGYVAFATFLLQQLLWAFTVISTAYLLSATVNDVAELLARNDAHRGAVAEPQDAPGASTGAHGLRKWIVLGTGLAQASIALLAMLLLSAAFGRESFGLVGHLDSLQGYLKWGEVQIRPMAIVQGLTLFLLGASLIHVLKNWLTEHFFPATGLDAGVQSSLSTLVSYIGYIVVLAMALSVTGVGFERVTWIASALSVGIGFGLQAIVQNFVSGLILLAERPVKVGDWVSLGGIEGDIRRINVRATEIEMNDRSTVIVPNSELVTKMVRNITYADSLGRVQFKLTLPLDTPADRVRQIILAAFASDANILTTPAPSVLLDDITSSGLVFNAFAFVAGPRLAYRTRSAILFDTLERLAEAGIATSSPTTLVLAQPAEAFPPGQTR